MLAAMGMAMHRVICRQSLTCWLCLLLYKRPSVSPDSRPCLCMWTFAPAWPPLIHNIQVCLLNAAEGNDGLHNKISNVFWWAWNANSGDTGGIVQQDWLTINWNKVDWMVRVGLTPWYANKGSSSSSSSG